MGVSATAELRYGYDLGGNDRHWLVAGLADEWEPWVPSWADGDDFESLEGGEDEANLRLLEQLAGFTEQWRPGLEGYWDRRRAAAAKVGVEMIRYGHHEFSSYALVIDNTTGPRTHANCPEPRHLDPAELERARQEGHWDDKLDAALHTLDLKPTSPRGWLLLVSYT